MRRLILPLLAALLFAVPAFFGGANEASAHAFLARANPAVGSTVRGSPSKLELWYTEGVELAFSKVTIKGNDGRPIAAGPLTADPNDKAHLEMDLPQLAPGTYSVSWQVVAVDTHRTTGTFKFTLAP